MTASSETSEGRCSAEFRLAVECCRPGDGRPEIAPADLDWDDFLRLVRFHRIEGLAWHRLGGMRGVPAETKDALREDAAAIAAQNLRAAAESRDLLEAFEAAKVPCLFLKGVTLGALAYGNPALKSGIDIDLLIHPNSLAQAAEILWQCGYRLLCPRAERLRGWHRTWKESLWVKQGSPLQLDLHTRVANNPRLIPAITVDSPRRMVDAGGGVVLPTLCTDELFAYLAVHGASSAWFRLKWVADFAALLHGQGPDEIERLYRRSQELRAGRAAGQALLLADALFGTLRVNECLRKELESDSRTALVFRTALRLVRGRPVEPTERRFGTFAIHWTQFFLLRGVGYKAVELSGQAARALSRP